MPLVGVVDLRLRSPGQPRPQPQRPDPADAAQEFLLQPVLAAAAVEAVGDTAGGLVVLLDVGVQQQQRHAADLRLPDLGVQPAAAGQVHRHLRRAAVALAQQRQGQAVGVQDRVGLLLPAVARERLLEVPRRVEQPHADDGHGQVAGRLQVVPREDPEPAGVLRQRAGDPELHGEVRDRGGRVGAQPGVPAGPGQVRLEVGGGCTDPLDELRVLRERVEPFGAQSTQQRPGFAVHRDPGGGVHGLEQVPGGLVPRPPQVARQVTQRRQGRREHGADGEAPDCSHGADPRPVITPPRRVHPHPRRLPRDGRPPSR